MVDPAIGDGYIINIDGKAHLVAISRQPDDGGTYKAREAKTGLMGFLQRRSLNAGHGLVILSITVVALILGLVGFFMSSKFHPRSANCLAALFG